MKTKLLVSYCAAVALAAIGSQLIGTPVSSAQDLYPADLDAFGISTNAEGRLVYKTLDNRDLIRDTASAAGITNLSGLSLVFNVQANDLEVVGGTNHTVVGTPLTFNAYVSLTNTNNTKGQFLEYVYWDTNSVPSGTMAAGVSTSYGPTNQITDYSLQGQLQFASSDTGTNSPVIYLGHLSVEKRMCFYPVTPVVFGGR